MAVIYCKDICCRYTLDLPLRGNFNVYLQHMLLKITKKNYLEIYIFQVSCPLLSPQSFKHPKLPISIKIAVTLLQIVYLHDSYISKFEFVNYLLASLLVVWSYLPIEAKWNFQLLSVRRDHFHFKGCWVIFFSFLFKF